MKIEKILHVGKNICTVTGVGLSIAAIFTPLAPIVITGYAVAALGGGLAIAEEIVENHESISDNLHDISEIAYSVVDKVAHNTSKKIHDIGEIICSSSNHSVEEDAYVVGNNEASNDITENHIDLI